MLDAFSSDSVPVHLLTKEAIDAYLSRLRPGGIAALHISNKYLDLEPVIGRLAAERRLPALTNADLDISPAETLRGRAPTQWVVIASTAEPLASLGRCKAGARSRSKMVDIRGLMMIPTCSGPYDGGRRA